ncbi:hypothetical protein A8H39_00110 [Paraburkholderia fungorum]|uniref:DUF4241 domain-containing protein n=1 Tax=Paraburkholderia fungorum TaxID=134537 RepID=UPI00048607AD|nr:DUF4241 domain-containing protein [Paraburkholderia fungorum]MBB5546529.1 hypothetical protein [Paraburkholderia fungorum]PNE59589.1 hypothetical protein A8H39_00110 [Paraburkholderia fungorum]
MNSKKSMDKNWERIGEVPVDSGQVMLVDPTYIDSNWQDKPFEDIRQYRHKESGKVLQYRKDFPHYEAVIQEFGQTMNQLNATGEWDLLEQPVPNELSYNAACRATGQQARGGAFGGLATAVGTAYGDGEYPVFVQRDEYGRILRVMIDFTEQ